MAAKSWIIHRFFCDVNLFLRKASFFLYANFVYGSPVFVKRVNGTEKNPASSSAAEGGTIVGSIARLGERFLIIQRNRQSGWIV